MRKILGLISLFLPWRIRRLWLKRFFGYKLHPKSRIRLSWVFPAHLEMGEGAVIDNFTLVKHIDTLRMEEHTFIGRLCWITGSPLSSRELFVGEDRQPMLHLEKHAEVTSLHHIDCTNKVRIGEYSIVAGYATQFLTHSVDLEKSEQRSRPITIGKYCFIGTNSVILGGSEMADYCVLGAKSLLNKQWTQKYVLLGGVPAKIVKELSPDMKYFKRKKGTIS
ncbi:hypothetical protein IAD21_06254 [Abditibacteriota bacterium]|nr:hypothetical protein IAD21_06254 [Abditibacteriota bacterium]